MASRCSAPVLLAHAHPLPQPAIARELLRRMGIPEAVVTWVCITEDVTGFEVIEALTAGTVDLSPSYAYSEASIQTYPNVSWGPVTDQAADQVIVRVRTGAPAGVRRAGRASAQARAAEGLLLGSQRQMLSCRCPLLPTWDPMQATPVGASVDSWQLLNAFSPALWLALLGTSLGVGLLAFLVEVATQVSGG